MNLYLFTDTLIKTAKEDSKESPLNKGEAALGASLLFHPSTKKNITGRETFYHGTAPQHAEKIKQEGIIPSKMKGSTDILEVGNPEAATSSRNMSFVTPNKAFARQYAVKSKDVTSELEQLTRETGKAPTTLDSAREHLYWQQNAALDPSKQLEFANPLNNKGILEINMPTWKADIASKIKQNPETAMGFDRFYSNIKKQSPIKPPRFVIKNIYNALDSAKGIEGGVPTEFIKGAPNYKRLGLKELGSYIKNKPGSFTKGVGALGLGAGLAGHGLYNLLKKEKTAEEKAKEEVSYGERAKRAIPYIIGMGAGGVASSILKTQLKGVKNKALLKGIQYGVPAITALTLGSVFPKIKKQFEDDVYLGKK
jgi:hypothetical protein